MRGKLIFILMFLLILMLTHLCPAQQEGSLPSKGSTLQAFAEQLAEVVCQVDPSVVTVITVKNNRSQFATGVIYNADGYVLTTRLIIEGAERLEVILPSGSKYEVTPIGTDSITGIGVVKITAPDLLPAKFGDSDRLKEGEFILVIGDSFGLSRSLTTGVISNLDHEINGRKLIQITAPINPSMSGAPVINGNGEVVGIIQARLPVETLSSISIPAPSPIRSTVTSAPVGTSSSILCPLSEGAEGTSFAVPINDVRFAAEQLIKKGVVTRGWLGAEVQPVPNALRAQLNLEKPGILVSEVLKDSPAQKAGIERWDIILEFQGNPIDSPKTLQRMLYRTPPEGEVELLILRKGRQKRIKAKIEALQERPTGSIPTDFTLSSFLDAERGGAWITYNLPWEAHLTLSIYDIKGELIRRIDLGRKRPGYYITKEKAAYWDGKNTAGEPVSDGVYICTAKAGKESKTIKIVVIRR